MATDETNEPGDAFTTREPSFLEPKISFIATRAMLDESKFMVFEAMEKLINVMVSALDRKLIGAHEVARLRYALKRYDGRTLTLFEDVSDLAYAFHENGAGYLWTALHNPRLKRALRELEAQHLAHDVAVDGAWAKVKEIAAERWYADHPDEEKGS
jgi:hypothetical protein